MSILDTIAGGLFWLFLLVVGVALVGYAVDRVANVRAILGTSTSDAGFVSAGRVELEGRVHAREVLTGPVTGSQCVAYEWEVEVYDRDPGDVLKDWDTLTQGGATVPFAVRDGTGEVLVDPAMREVDATVERLRDDLPESDGRLASGPPRYFDLPETDEVVVPAGETPPERVAAFLEEREHRDLTHEHERRFTERRLEADTEVYVLGHAVEGGETTVENRAGERFVVSARSETRTALRNAGAAVAAFVAGVLLVVVSGWILLSIAGLL